MSKDASIDKSALREAPERAPGRGVQDEMRRERLAANLRENLHRRKALARAQAKHLQSNFDQASPLPTPPIKGN